MIEIVMLSEHFHIRIARVLPSQFGIVHANHTMICAIAVHSVSVVTRVMMRIDVVMLIAMVVLSVMQMMCIVVLVLIDIVVRQCFKARIQFVHEQTATAAVAIHAKFRIRF